MQDKGRKKTACPEKLQDSLNVFPQLKIDFDF